MSLLRIAQLLWDIIRGYSKHKSLKSPILYPFLGNLDVLFNQDRLLDYMTDTYKALGKNFFVNLAFMPSWFFTSEPEILEHIHKAAYHKYKKAGFLAENLAEFLGSGIFAVDDEAWKLQRKIAANIFTVKNFRDFFCSVFWEELEKVVGILDSAAKAGTVVNLHDLFHMFTMESFTLIGFGIHLGLFEGNEKGIAFTRAFDRAQSIIDARFTNPFWKFTELLNGRKRELKQCLLIMEEFTHDVISQRLDQGEIAGDDLLSRFVQTEKFDQSQLHDIIINFIIAGRDTTAQALSWCFFNILQNPQIIENMRSEIAEHVSKRELFSPRPFPHLPNSLTLNYEDVQQLKYIKATFSETLRLHPSVPKQSKVAVEDDIWPDGTFIPAGSWACWSSYAMGRLESVWGKDATEFKPERFIDCPNPSQYKFPAFNMGPRLCLGMNMAYLEATLALAVLIDAFDFKPVNLDTVTYNNALSLPMKQGISVFVSKRRK